MKDCSTGTKYHVAGARLEGDLAILKRACTAGSEDQALDIAAENGEDLVITWYHCEPGLFVRKR